MLDVLLSRVKEEIAIDGTTGSNIGTVWEYVETISRDIAEQSNASVTPLIDDRYKTFLWNYLKIEPDLEFYEHRSSPYVTNQSETVSDPQRDSSRGPVAESNTNMEEIDCPIDNEELQEASPSPVTKKRKDPPVKKKPAPKKRAKPKPKPKKKRAARKKAYRGGSDDDFEGGSDDESSSESDFSDVSEESEEFMTEDDEEDIEPKKRNAPKPAKVKKTNPANATSLTSAPELDLKPISNIAELSYDQVNSQYGSRLYILGSPELQEEQLYTGVPPATTLSPNLVVILKEIIRHRSKGLYQASITKLLDLDSRSTGHYVKSLEEKGAITRHGVSINSMYTNICVHARFKVEKESIDMNTVGDDDDVNEVPYNVNGDGKVYSQHMVRDAMIDLAKDAPNHAVMAQDVLHGLGFDSTRKCCRKWFNRVIDELCLKGYFKKSNAKVNSLGQHQRCLHLLRIPDDYHRDATQISDFTPERIEFPFTAKSSDNNYPIVHLLVDSSLETQCLQILLAAGTHGVTQKDIGFALNLDEPRTIYKLLEKMVELKGIGADRYSSIRHLEFEGRLRRYRYYSFASYKKLTENIDIVPEPLRDSEFDESVLFESDYFLEAPHTLKELNRHIDAIRTSGRNTNTLSVLTLSQKKAPMGRPRKHPKKDTPPSDTSKKRGRPKSNVNTQNKAKKPKQDNEASATSNVSIVNQLGTSTAISNQPNLPINVDEPSMPPAAASNAAEVTSTDIPETSNATIASTNEDGASPQTIAEPTIHITNPLLPCPAIMQTRSASSPAKKKQVLLNATGSLVRETKTPKETTSSPQVTLRATTVPRKFSSVDTTEKSKPVPEKAKKATANTSKNAKAIEPVGRTLRKRTIADYFAKVGGTRAAVRVSDESVPEPESTIVSSEIEQLQSSTDANSQTEAASVPIELMEIDQVPVPVSESIAVAESAPEPVPVNEPIIVTESAPESVLVSIESQLNSEESKLGEPTEDMEISEPEPVHDIPQPVSEDSASVEPTNGRDAETSDQGSFSSDAINQIMEPKVTITTSKPIKQTIVAIPKKRIQHNMYLERRITVLLAILEEKPIVEVGKELHDAYDQKATEMQYSSKSVICNKTIWRTAQELTKRNLAQIDIVPIPMLNGNTVIRKMVVRNDVDLEGEQYKNYIRHMHDRKTMNAGHYPHEKLETMAKPVERLEQRLHRMALEVQHLLDQGEKQKAHALEKRVEELSRNLDRFGREHNTSSGSSFWLITALQYGFINARMIRVKLLHKYIFGILARGAPDTTPDERIVSVKSIINNMPLSILCQAVGLGSPDEQTLAYVRDPKNSDTTFNDLPLEIKQGVFNAQNKIIQRLRAPVRILLYLDILSPVFTEPDGARSQVKYSKYSNKVLSYKLNNKVPVKIIKKKGQPVLSVFEIEDTNDLNQFWNEVQYASLNTELLGSSEDDLEPPPKDPVENDLFGAVIVTRNWSTSTVFSRAQRKALNSYVNKDQKTTPLGDLAIIRHISDSLDIPVPVVRSYYEKVQVVMNRRLEVNEMKRIKRRITPSRRRSRKPRAERFEGRRVISLKSTRAFHPREFKTRLIREHTSTPDTETTVLEELKKIDEKRSKGELLYMDSMDDLPVLPNDSVDTLRLPRLKRTLWTSQDDELLIYAYIILRYRTAKLFRWAAITQVFPDRIPNSCRNRLAKLLNTPTFSEQYETSAPLWDKYYRGGIASGELTDAYPKENVEFDLLAYVTYFITKLSQGNTSEQTVYLPSSLQAMREIYDISLSNLMVNHYFEDMFHDSASMASKMQILYNQTFTVRKQNSAMYDQTSKEIDKERDPKFRQSNMCKAVLLMALMTPSEVFDPFYSYSILRKFPKNLQREVTERMNAEGSLIKAGGARSIPGTRLGLSNKFVSTMVGKLPQTLFSQASEYERFLNDRDEKVRLSSDYISSGMMACLLNLISDQKLMVTMANPRTVLAKAENMFVTSKSAKIKLLQFDLDIQKIDRHEQYMGRIPPSDEPHIIEMDENQFSHNLSEILVVQDQFFSKLLKQTVELIRAEEECGLTLYQLKSKLSDLYTDDDILLALHKLCSNDPALVCRVGYEAVRYVLAIYIDHWAIVTKNIETYRMDDAESNEQVQEMKKVIPRKGTVVPNLWTDINGSVTDLVLKGCKEVIVDIVLRKPGISEADIHRHLDTALCRREVRDLLNILVEQQVLKQVQVSVLSEPKKKLSVFGKTKQATCTNNNVIQKLTQSCFWVTPNAYLNVIN